MVNYWLCVTNEKNWKVVKERKVWGVTGRNLRKIQNVSPGDLMIFYVKPKRIAGIFRSVTNLFENNEIIFSSKGFTRGEIFSHRVRIEPVITPKKWMDFTKVISKLSFIKRKNGKWAGSIQGRALIPISEEDYRIIEDEIKKSSKKTCLT